MIRNELVGIVILTYNRPQTFYNLADVVSKCQFIDKIVIIKDQHIDYDKHDPAQFSSEKCKFMQLEGKHNIAYNKNIGIKALLEDKCQHIFVIEDDIVINDINVFEKYIETAKTFKLGHLNWNNIPEVDHNPVYSISHDGQILDIAFRVCGCFSYFSRDALMHCGLLDEVNFYNAYEHAEHAYRMSLQNFTTPFYAFADIHDSFKYLSNVGEGKSTLDHESESYKRNLYASAMSFKRMYGRTIGEIPIPTQDDVCKFLQSNIKRQ